MNNNGRELGGGVEAAIREGELFKARVLCSDSMLTTDKAASRLGIAIKTLNTWRKSGRVLGLKGLKQAYRYPKFQFEDHMFPFIGKVLAAMPNYGPWEIYLFLTQPEPLLCPGTPLDWLRKGKFEEVLRVAKIINDEIA